MGKLLMPSVKILFYLTNIDVNYVPGTVYTVVKTSPDLCLELMELFLDDCNEEPAAHWSSLLQFQYGMPRLV